MKVFVFLLMAITVCSTRLLRGSSYGDQVNSILDMLPFDKIHDILERQRDNEEVADAREYLRSDEFRSLWDQVTRDEDVKKFVDALESDGVHVRLFVSKLFKMANVPDSTVLQTRSLLEPGLSKVEKEILAVTPLEEIKNHVQSLINSNPDLVKVLNSTITKRALAVIVQLMQNNATPQTKTRQLLFSTIAGAIAAVTAIITAHKVGN